MPLMSGVATSAMDRKLPAATLWSVSVHAAAPPPLHPGSGAGKHDNGGN